MKRREKGQGLVEYALILALVAIVVIAVLQLLGPIIGGNICTINNALDPDPDYSVTMGLGDDFVVIDVKEGFGSCASYALFGEVVTGASHGIAQHQGDGIYTYAPSDAGSGLDDSFTYSWKLNSQPNYSTGLVTVTVGEPDNAISQSIILSATENKWQEMKPKPKFSEVELAIFALVEQVEEQEENFQEGADLAVEALGEGLEVLIEFADDSGDLLLSASLSQLLAEVRAGNLGAVQAAITQIGTGLALAPVEVWLDMSLKMAPSLTKSCVVVSEARVSSDAINAASEAIEGLDDDHPGKADALLLLQEAVATIEERNTAAAEYVDFQSIVLQTFVAGFELVGEYEIAAQLAADSEACGN